MENKKQDKLKETFIFIALLVLMILRFFKLACKLKVNNKLMFLGKKFYEGF